MNIIFATVEGDKESEPVATLLYQLLTESRLPLWLEALSDEAQTFDQDGGDCHVCALALLTDLALAGFDDVVLAKGRLPKVGLHSWIEWRGCAFDANAPQLRDGHIFISKKWDFIAAKRPRDVKRQRARDFAKRGR